MRRSPILIALVVAIACAAPKHDCDELIDRALTGPLVDDCWPDRQLGLVHFEGPPGGAIHCFEPDYELEMPDCKTIEAGKSSQTDAAICRALSAFPEVVERVGPNPRIDVEAHAAADRTWVVRFKALEDAVHERGVLVAYSDRRDPIAILF